MPDADISESLQMQAGLTRNTTPRDRVTDIARKAGEWTEPSLQSEGEYVDAVRDWVESLPGSTRAKVYHIMRDAHPTLHSLRNAIRSKKAQLASLTYGRSTTPETLPRLGLQLQKLKAELRAELTQLKSRLSREAGVDLGPLGKDAFWIALPDQPQQRIGQ